MKVKLEEAERRRSKKCSKKVLPKTCKNKREMKNNQEGFV
jgi:hypothetical protein